MSGNKNEIGGNMITEEDIFVNEVTGKKAVSIYAADYRTWKEREREVFEQYPDAHCTMCPGLGYAGEYWYDIEPYEAK